MSFVKMSKQWYTHDNGGRPFLVKQEGPQRVSVYRVGARDANGSAYWNKSKRTYHEKIFDFMNVEKIFVGKDNEKWVDGTRADGNSILLRLPDNIYVVIGTSVYSFRSLEPIERFYSEIVGSDVAYPVATSKKYAYFLIAENVSRIFYVNRSDTRGRVVWRRAYTQFYNNHWPKHVLHTLPIKVLYERI